MPDRIDRYELGPVIGKGAAGTVYKALDTANNRRVALKTIPLPVEDDESSAESYRRFKREAETARSLSHPGIVRVLDSGEAANVAFIAMELIDGWSLKQKLDDGLRLSPAEVVQIMRALLDALAFSHGKGVIHRDIKPSNILFTHDGVLKITDFGIARIEGSSMTQFGTVMGTPSYMSPEQFTGQAVDARTDVYAAGVLLYQLLTGEKPFEGGPTAIMHKVLNAMPPAPSALSVTAPSAFDAVVARAMARRPDARYPSAQAFAAALEAAWAGGTPSPGSQPDATVFMPAAMPAQAAPSAVKPEQERGPPPPWKRPAALGAVAVLGILAAGGGYLALHPTSAPAPIPPVAPPAERPLVSPQPTPPVAFATSP